LYNEKLPPHDPDAEEAVIGSLLIDGNAIYKVASLVQSSDFYYEPNQLIYSACYSLYQRNDAINQITVAQELARQNKLEPCGGAAHLSHLIAICPTSLDIEHYAQIVYRLSTMRNLITAADKIAALGHEAGPNVDGLPPWVMRLARTSMRASTRRRTSCSACAMAKAHVTSSTSGMCWINTSSRSVRTTWKLP